MDFIYKCLNHRIIVYAVVGGISTLIHILAAYAYIYIVSNSIYMSNIIGFLSAFSFSYIMQSKLVFKKQLSYIKAIKYFVVQFISLLIAIIITDYTPIDNSYLEVVLVIILLPLITYFTHNLWTFSEPQKAGNE